MPLHGLDNVKKAMKEQVNEMNNGLKAVYIKHLSAVIRATPVHFKDGGRLRNNWFLSVDNPEFKTTLIKSKQGTSSYMQLNEMPKLVIGKKIYFTNNMPYAAVVEYGGYPNPPKYGTWVSGAGFQKLSSGSYSKQAPRGMVRINMVKLQNEIKRL